MAVSWQKSVWKMQMAINSCEFCSPLGGKLVFFNNIIILRESPVLLSPCFDFHLCQIFIIIIDIYIFSNTTKQLTDNK